jgi:hypothetical protein
MATTHTREQVRLAKAKAAARFKDDLDVTSVGIGMTEDRKDYAVTITVADEKVLEKLPSHIGNIPVRAAVSGLNKLF